jgi:hypothetical protein
LILKVNFTAQIIIFYSRLEFLFGILLFLFLGPLSLGDTTHVSNNPSNYQDFTVLAYDCYILKNLAFDILIQKKKIQSIQADLQRLKPFTAAHDAIRVKVISVQCVGRRHQGILQLSLR